MNFKEIFKITLTLLITFLCVGGALALVNAITAPRIAKNQLSKQNGPMASTQIDSLLRTVCSGAESFEKAGSWTIHNHEADYYVAHANGAPSAYIIKSYAKGYSSLISVLVCVTTEFTVKSISILDQQETPGLGDGVSAPEFTAQFAGKTCDQLKVATSPTKDCIQAVSAATISSRAVTEDAVKTAVLFLKSKFAKDSK